MTEAFWIALLVGVGSPALLALLNNWNRRSERQEDFARQDAVAAKVTDAAARAAEAARLLVSQQASLANSTAEAARLLAASNQRVEDKTAEITKVTLAKLDGIAKQGDVIHTLVNSTLTAAIKAQYDATIRELAMMREVIDLKRKSGHQPSEEAMAAVKATEATIAELSSVLADRLAQTKAAAALA